MTPKRAARIAAFVTLGGVGVVSFGRAALGGVWDLLLNAPFLTALLGAPLAAAAGTLTYRWRTATDSPETAVARSGEEWIDRRTQRAHRGRGPARASTLRPGGGRRGPRPAMLPVAATEAAHMYSEAGVSLLDGETVQVDSTSAAVLDTLHPVFLVLHLLFWLPGPVLGARLGARANPLN